MHTRQGDSVDSQAQQTAGRHGSQQTHLGDVRVNVLGAQLPLTLGVEQAARIVGVGRSSMYAAIKRGDIQTIGLNGRTAVLTVPLLQRMGLPMDAAGHLEPRSSATD
jgi:hypothetical protein